MMDRDYISHNSHNGETYDARLRRFGYTLLPSGENISWGSGSYGSADSRFKFWMNSAGHRANILNSKFKQIGVGAVHGNHKGNNVTMWTANFGSR